ncbi:MAG: hypothetical protein U0X75_07010 [Acidobacteriota bacterium]
MMATKQTPQTAAEMLALTHANVIDGVSAQPCCGATVIVRAGRIESVLTNASAAPANATVIDLQGRWLLPGLIDAHTHIADLAAARGMSGRDDGAQYGRSAFRGHRYAPIASQRTHRPARNALCRIPPVSATCRRVVSGFFPQFRLLAGLGGGRICAG